MFIAFIIILTESLGSTWKGNDKEPIRSNFTSCPRHQHIQLRRRKVKQRWRKPRRQLLLRRWPQRYSKSQRQSESALLLWFINIQVIQKPKCIRRGGNLYKQILNQYFLCLEFQNAVFTLNTFHSQLDAWQMIWAKSFNNISYGPPKPSYNNCDAYLST